MFELFVHQLLLSLHFDVEVHPAVPGTQARPDFLIRRGVYRLYVEVTEVNPTKDLFAPDPLEDTVLDAIDELDSPNFFISITTKGKLSSAPRHQEVVRPFADLMAAHKPDDVSRLIASGGIRAAPSVEVAHGEWTLRGELMPKSSARRGTSETRTIGIGPAKGGFIDSSTPVKRALVKKAGKYGELDAPYVVAVNARGVDDRIDEMEALFGKERFTFRVDRLNGPPEFSREPDGVWIRGGHAPRYTRLQAVLLFRGVMPWNLPHAYACLYLNPYTPVDLPNELLRLPHAKARDGEMEWIDGEDIGRLLNVQEDWLTQATGGS